MKPIRLTMTAFGPYPREEVIDFEALNGRYLFLITGPTGSGKTTLFDAMSYAIYGESSGSLRPTDSFRSQFAAEDDLTTVNFIFELHNERYEVERVPRQWRPKSVGEGYTEQKPEATLRFLSQDKRPLSGVTQVTKALEELIGLSEEQFKQIMMIPQGEFRQLLIATSEEREKVLKRLFDTSIYRQIQEVLTKRATTIYAGIKEASTKRDALMGTLEWTHYYEDDEADEILGLSVAEQLESFESKLNQENHKMMDAEKALKKQQTVFMTLNKEKEAQQIVNQKFERRGALVEERITLDEQKNAINTIEKQIDEASKALLVKPYEKAWADRQRDHLEDTKASSESKETFNRYEKQLEEAVVRYEKEFNEDKEKEIKALEKSIEQWSEFIEVVEKKEQCTIRQKASTLEESKKKEKLENQEALIEKQKSSKERLDQLKIEHIENHMKLQKLKDASDKIKEQEENLIRFEEGFRTLKKYQDTYAKLDKAIHGNRDYLAVQREGLKVQRRSFMEHQGAVLAQGLVDGEPCPVCGSVHHPNPSSLSTVTVDVDALEEEENRLNQFETQLNEQISQQARIETRIQQYKETYESFARFCESKNVEYNETSPINACDQLSRVLQDERVRNDSELKKAQATQQAFDKEEKSLSDLAKRSLENQELYNKMKADYDRVREERFKIEAELEQIMKAYEVHKSNMNLEEDVSRDELHQLKGNVTHAYTHCMDRRREVKERYEETLKQRDSEAVRYKQLDEQVKRSKDKMEQMLVQYEQMRREQGFETEEAYKRAILYDLQLKKYKEDVLAYYDKRQGIEHEIQVIEKELDGKEKKDLEPLQLQIDALEEMTGQMERDYTLMGDRLLRSRDTLEKVKQLHQSIGEQEEDYKKVGFLSNYGQGKNPAMLSFERFALAAFLEDILEAANYRLNAMTDGRYHMKRSQKLERKNRQSGLDIDIYDFYSGMSRSVKTLSGGESFKASLAMALGLSDVVQSYAGGVRLDTMFIDEGFGTLDQESLDSAIACLSQLEESGRLVGIISHVQELKERIPTQLRVHVGTVGSYTEFVVND